MSSIVKRLKKNSFTLGWGYFFVFAEAPSVLVPAFGISSTVGNVTLFRPFSLRGELRGAI